MQTSSKDPIHAKVDRKTPITGEQPIPPSTYLEKQKWSPAEKLDHIGLFVDISPGVAEYTAGLRNMLRQTRLALELNTDSAYGEFNLNEDLIEKFKEAMMKEDENGDRWLLVASSPLFLSFMHSYNSAFDMKGTVNCDLDKSNGMIKILAVGEKAICDKVIEMAKEFFPMFESQFTVFSAANGGINRERKRMPSDFGKRPLPCFYPWLEQTGQSLEEFYQAYLESDEAILILMGPPGTGKTTWLRGMIPHIKSNIGLCNDTQLMASAPGDLVLELSNGNVDVMIFEDADALIGTTRKEGNAAISSLLNTSDGLIPTDADRKIKMIFTTNLTDLNAIEEALRRPGRCFAVINFSYLTNEQAKRVADELGIENYPVEKMDKHTVATITNWKPERIEATPVRKVGFL